MGPIFRKYLIRGWFDWINTWAHIHPNEENDLLPLLFQAQGRIALFQHRCAVSSVLTKPTQPYSSDWLECSQRPWLRAQKKTSLPWLCNGSGRPVLHPHLSPQRKRYPKTSRFLAKIPRSPLHTSVILAFLMAAHTAAQLCSVGQIRSTQRLLIFIFNFCPYFSKDRKILHYRSPHRRNERSIEAFFKDTLNLNIYIHTYMCWLFYINFSFSFTPESFKSSQTKSIWLRKKEIRH